MNRRVARYSAFASVAVAAVLGIVYFAFLSGSQADDGGSGDSSTAEAASASAHREGSSQPDSLFSEPVQVGELRQSTSSAPDPFQRRTSDVVPTAYGEAEPRRLPVNPNANPLRSAGIQPYGNRSQPAAQLTGGGQSEASASDEPAADTRRDPFGLQNTLREAPPVSTSKKAPAAATGAASAGAALQSARPAKQPAAGSPSSRSNRQPASASLQAIDPTPLQRAPADDGASGAASAADLPSVLERSRSLGASVPAHDEIDESTNEPQGDGQSSHDVASQGAPMQLGSRFGLPNADHRSPARGVYTDQVGEANDSNAGRRPDARSSTTSAQPRGRSAATSIGLAPPEALAPQSAYAGTAGGARPGSRQVEGQQVPQITIEKTAPQEVQIGKTARFELRLRNTGTVVAQGVEVHDFVPEGTQFVAANPPASPTAQGELIWTLGALKPGDETTIEVELTPITEGEVGSVAFVALRAEAGARSRVTRPDLTLQVTADKQVMIGHEVMLSIKIGNPGTGPATGVVIEEHVPPGLKHSAGAELEFEVGTLKPGETRELELALTAAQAGRIVNQIVARAEGNLHEEAQCELEVIAPALAIAMEGPSRRYLERQATYTVSVSNPGTAPAKDVELVTRLPKGLKFVKANNAGHYDALAHAVSWSLEELPPSETGTVMLTAIPVEPGEQRLRAEGRARQNLADEEEQLTVVEGLAALLFEVIDVADPIEVKGETQYQIRVMNQGSKAADNVQLIALLPPELKFVSADGPTRHTTKGQQVIFEPLGRLAPKADTAYRIVVQGVQPGDVRMKIQLRADDLDQPITKEESTRVYSDE